MTNLSRLVGGALLLAGLAGPLPAAPIPTRSSAGGLWAQSYVNQGDQRPFEIQPAYHFHNYGFTVGYNQRFWSHWIGGLSLARHNDHFEFPDTRVDTHARGLQPAARLYYDRGRWLASLTSSVMTYRSNVEQVLDGPGGAFTDARTQTLRSYQQALYVQYNFGSAVYPTFPRIYKLSARFPRRSRPTLRDLDGGPRADVDRVYPPLNDAGRTVLAPWARLTDRDDKVDGYALRGATSATDYAVLPYHQRFRKGTLGLDAGYYVVPETVLLVVSGGWTRELKRKHVQWESRYLSDPPGVTYHNEAPRPPANTYEYGGGFRFFTAWGVAARVMYRHVQTQRFKSGTYSFNLEYGI